MQLNKIKQLNFNSLTAKILAIFLVIGILICSHIILQLILNAQTNSQLNQLQQSLSNTPESIKNAMQEFSHQQHKQQKIQLISLVIIAIFIIIAGFLSLKTTLINPVKLLIKNFKRLAQGEENIVLRIDRDDELGLLGACFNEININLQQAMSTWELVMESEACKAAISDAALDGILTLDSHLVINTFNLAANNMLKIDDFDMSGQFFPDIAFLEKNKEKYTELLRLVSNDSKESTFSHATEIILYGRENKTFSAEISVASVLQKGEPIYIVYIRDISLQKQAKLDMQKSRDAAVILTHKQSDFMANISHELRTPMNGLLGLLNILNTELSLLPDQQTHMSAAMDSADRLQNIINKIINFSQLDSDNLIINNVDFLLKDLVDLTYNHHITSTTEKQLLFTIKISEKCPQSLHSDASCISQCINLLIENAIKFTLEGSINLSIEFDNTENDQCFIFIVSDTGCGIHKKHYKDIFKPFTQVDTSRSRSFEGTGIGLYICKEISELLDGELTVESNIGQGCKFYFVIPYTKTITNDYIKTLVATSVEITSEKTNSVDEKELKTVFDLLNDAQKNDFIQHVSQTEKELLTQLKLSIEEHNSEQSCQLIHSLKNTYSNIHATRALEYCDQFETEINAGANLEKSLEKLKILAEESENIMSKLKQLAS